MNKENNLFNEWKSILQIVPLYNEPMQTTLTFLFVYLFWLKADLPGVQIKITLKTSRNTK